MKVENEVNVTFILERRTVNIKCKVTENLKNIFKKFIYQINTNYILNDFVFYYEGRRLDDDSKVLNDIISSINNIVILVERKERIIKCPKCGLNDCIIKLDNYQIIFYGCKYNHITCILLDDYDESQKIAFHQIKCYENSCKERMNDNFQDFYKCLTCTKLIKHSCYLCEKHSSKREHDTSHVIVRFEDKYYYCEKHFNKFIEYCFKCNKNLCHECLNDHKGENHQVKNYESLSPNLNEIKENLNKIKYKINDLRCIIESIKMNLDGAFKIYENYYKIANDIIEKYEKFNEDLKNYSIFRSILNLKISNKQIIEDLEIIINQNNMKERIFKLIDIFEKDRKFYSNIKINNKGKENEQVLVKSGMDDYKEWKEENIHIFITKYL